MNLENIIALCLAVVILCIMILAIFIVNAVEKAKMKGARNYKEYLSRKRLARSRAASRKVLRCKGSNKAVKSAKGSALTQK